VQQYEDLVQLDFQQEGSLLRDKVRNKSVTGKSHFFERIGSTGVIEKTVRHQDTPQIDTPHARRRIDMRDFWWADLIDQEDRVRLLIEPGNEYATNAGWSMGRKVDELIIAAFEANAKGGETGSTSVPFDSNMAVAADLDSAGGNEGLTTAKLRRAKRLLDGKHAKGKRFFATSEIGLEQLLGTTAATSSDFNTVKALVNGEINSWLGFEFVMIPELLPITGNIRTCYAWVQRSMGLGIGSEKKTRITEAESKGFATRVFVQMSFDSTRIEEEGVVKVDIDESIVVNPTQ
jgi:hypothetical protein